MPEEQEGEQDESPIVAPPPRPGAKTLRLDPKPRAFETKNVLQLARARLRAVKAELRRLEALQKERTELERLIEAATVPRITKT